MDLAADRDQEQLKQNGWPLTLPALQAGAKRLPVL